MDVAFTAKTKLFQEMRYVYFMFGPSAQCTNHSEIPAWASFVWEARPGPHFAPLLHLLVGVDVVLRRLPPPNRTLDAAEAAPEPETKGSDCPSLAPLSLPSSRDPDEQLKIRKRVHLARSNRRTT